MNTITLKRTCALCSILWLLLLCICSKNCPNNAGGTETGDAKIVGVLYLPDGMTPAAGSSVTLRKKSLPDSLIGGLKKTTVDVGSAYTDAQGRFSIDSVDSGTYVIEGKNGNNMVLIDSIRKTTPDSCITVTDTLLPAGAISGVIKMGQGGDPTGVVVLAFGIDRFVRVNSDGTFLFPLLAKGNYRISIQPLLVSGTYGALDSSSITVNPSDTTRLDTLDLPFAGVPAPKNVLLAYDSLKEIVSLTWDAGDINLVKSYNVYRRSIDSTSWTIVNSRPILVNSYNDSSASEGLTYEYRVSCINGQAAESARSSGVRVTIAGAYPFIKVLAPVGSNDGEVIRPRGIARNANGDLFVMDEGNSRIDKFDSSGRFLFSFGSSGIGDGQFDSPKDLAIDRWSSIYVTDNGQRSIQKYDSSGTFIKKWYTKGSPWGISVSPENIIYVALESDSSSIQAFDTGGASINELRTSQGNYDIFAGKGDTLLVSTISYTMDFFINTYVHGALINNWRISKEVSTCTFAFDDQGNLYVCGLLGSSCVEIFNAKNELIGRFGALGTREGAITSPNWIYLVGNKIYISANNGVLLFQKP